MGARLADVQDGAVRAGSVRSRVGVQPSRRVTGQVRLALLLFKHKNSMWWYRRMLRITFSYKIRNFLSYLIVRE